MLQLTSPPSLKKKMNEYVSMLAICWKEYSKSYQHVARNVGENVGRKCCSICARLN